MVDVSEDDLITGRSGHQVFVARDGKLRWVPDAWTMQAEGQKTWTSDYRVTPFPVTNYGPRGQASIITDTPDLRLRTGKWRFEVSNAARSGPCEAGQDAGTNSIVYHEVTKCTAG